MSVKVGADYETGVYGYKAYPAGPRGAAGQSLIILYSIETGLSAMVDGGLITQLRTGAVGAVGTKFLARPDSTTLGIIGTGNYAKVLLRATVLVHDFTKIFCYSRNSEKRERFAREMSEELAIEITTCETGEECVSEADVVTVITNSPVPVLMGSWLREGTHINGIGATRVDRRELDDEAVSRCDTIVVEHKDGAMNEVGELIHAVEQGKLTWDRVHEMKDAASGAVARKSPKDITLNDTVGVGAEDVALAWFAVNKAREQGVGRELDFDSI